MSKQYYRRKKSRDLKRKADLSDESDDCVVNIIKQRSNEGPDADNSQRSFHHEQPDNSQAHEHSAIEMSDASVLTSNRSKGSSPFFQDNGPSRTNPVFYDNWELQNAPSMTDNEELEIPSADVNDLSPDEDASFSVHDNEVSADEVVFSAHENESSKCLPDGMKEKLRAWALKNTGTLRLTVISELLVLLRSEGYVSLPKTAQALLGTVHCRRMRPMLSNRDTMGEYLYLGIQEGLAKRISSDIYNTDTIRILVHVDGMQIYKNSRKQFWPILVTLYDTKYKSSPFIAAIYSGDSKPKLASDFMRDFVTEAAELIRDGILITDKQYAFEIKAIVADSPARSFIKCCKGHNGFYACERCETKGVTINKKRVYPQTDSLKRTRKSFKKQRQPEHHLPDRKSPLLDLPKFNPVSSVILDSMHLLYLGVQKFLLERAINRSSASRITTTQLSLFKDLLKTLTSDIPDEFQRKVFDLDDFAHWKATQFRFILLYCGPLILRHILPKDYYNHYLLLFVACRILCSSELAVARADYANKLLRKFFFLLPSFYGMDSQVLNMHNLIHLSEDVNKMQAPLSDFSAFWGENYIGALKKLVRSQKNPLAQVVNRLSELESCDSVKMQLRHDITECTLETFSEVRCIAKYEQREFVTVRRLRMKDMLFSSVHPNNIVMLKDETIFRISRMLVEKNIAGNPKCASEIYVEGHGIRKEDCQSLFNKPILSQEIGVTRIKKFSHESQLRCADEIKNKVVQLTIKNKKYAVSLLHV